MNDIEMSFTALKDHIDKLKNGIDRCFIPTIYVQTYKIASIVKSIDTNKLTENQKKVLSKLDDETLKQFRRLSEGRCSCKVSKDI